MYWVMFLLREGFDSLLGCVSLLTFSVMISIKNEWLLCATISLYLKFVLG